MGDGSGSSESKSEQDDDVTNDISGLNDKQDTLEDDNPSKRKHPSSSSSIKMMIEKKAKTLNPTKQEEPEPIKLAVTTPLIEEDGFLMADDDNDDTTLDPTTVFAQAKEHIPSQDWLRGGDKSQGWATQKKQ